MYQIEVQPEDQITSYTIPDLEPNSIYYLRVNAVNALGEGYLADRPSFVRTMEDTLN